MSGAETDADVVIVGGGLVGSTLAAAIASHPLSQGLRLTLIDPSPPPSLQHWPSPSLRTSTISPSSQTFLEDVGVWSYLPPRRAVPFSDMLVWDHPGPLAHAAPPAPGAAPAGTLHFSPRDVDAPFMGHVVDNDALRLAAFHRLAALSANRSRVALTVLRDSVSTIDFGRDTQSASHAHTHAHPRAEHAAAEVAWPAVRLASGATVRARLLVAADGARSRVRAMADAQWFAHSYDQTAVVANVAVDAPFHTALQRFLPTGPVAMLPMCGPCEDGSERSDKGHANVIWTTSGAEAGALLRADDAVFVDELNAALAAHEDNGDDGDGGAAQWPMHSGGGGAGLWDMVARTASRAGLLSEPTDSGPVHMKRLPVVESVVGKRGKFPLWLGHAPRYVIAERRVALVGDAAHAVHPLAGQGVNLGFSDARRLAECVARAAAAGRDVGGESGAPLRRFEADRLVGNVAVMATLHGLHAAFGRSDVRGLRRAGMALLNAVPAAKRLIVRAMR